MAENGTPKPRGLRTTEDVSLTIPSTLMHLKYRIRQMGLEAATKALLDAGKLRSTSRNKETHNRAI